MLAGRVHGERGALDGDGAVTAVDAVIRSYFESAVFDDDVAGPGIYAVVSRVSDGHLAVFDGDGLVAVDTVVVAGR